MHANQFSLCKLPGYLQKTAKKTTTHNVCVCAYIYIMILCIQIYIVTHYRERERDSPKSFGHGILSPNYPAANKRMTGLRVVFRKEVVAQAELATDGQRHLVEKDWKLWSPGSQILAQTLTAKHI